MLKNALHTIRHTLDQKSFDYNQITGDIFIGTNMCCQYGFKTELLSQGVTADISLEAENIDAPHGVDYYLWLPTVDHEAIMPEKLELGIHTLELLMKRKVKTFIHCKNGHGRAPMFFAAYLIKTGLSVEDAIAQIKAKRPTIHINDIQLRALQRYQATLASPDEHT